MKRLYIYDEIWGLIEWLLIYLNINKIEQIFKAPTPSLTPSPTTPKNHLSDIDYIIERTIAAC